MELQALEKRNLLRALETCGWKISGVNGVSALMDLPPSTISSRMKALGIRSPVVGIDPGSDRAVLSEWHLRDATHFLKSPRPWGKIKRKYTCPIQMTVQVLTGRRRLRNYLNSAKAFNVLDNINMPSTVSVKVPLDTSENA